jgi:hypothetical protein
MGFRMVWLVSCFWKGNHTNGIQLAFRMCDVLQAQSDWKFFEKCRKSLIRTLFINTVSISINIFLFENATDEDYPI